MSERRWKEFHLSYDKMHRLEAIIGHQALPEGAIYRFEHGAGIFVTNLGMDILRRFCRLDDLRLPEPSRIPEDDEVVQEILAEHGQRTPDPSGETMRTPANPLDFLIWPRTFRGQPDPRFGYDFGFWVEDKLWCLGNAETPAFAETAIRSRFAPKSITVLDRKPDAEPKSH
jgi:hypothetical protein